MKPILECIYFTLEEIQKNITKEPDLVDKTKQISNKVINTLDDSTKDSRTRVHDQIGKLGKTIKQNLNVDDIPDHYNHNIGYTGAGLATLGGILAYKKLKRNRGY